MACAWTEIQTGDKPGPGCAGVLRSWRLGERSYLTLVFKERASEVRGLETVRVFVGRRPLVCGVTLCVCRDLGAKGPFFV